MSVDCPHGGTARRSCQDNMWTVPVLDCSSQVSAKVEQFLDNYVKLQVCRFVRRIHDHGLIRVVATTPEKTHNQKFLTFETILNRFLVQFYPGFQKKKKKKLPPLYIDQLKCGIRPDPPDPTLFGKPLCEKTERDRDMKISGFVDLDTADALKYVKI